MSDDAFARNNDPGTSHDAARKMRGEEAAKCARAAVAAIEQCGAFGAISDEIVMLSGYAWESITPRLKPLRVKLKLIEWHYDANGKPLWRRSDKSRRRQNIYWLTHRPPEQLDLELPKAPAPTAEEVASWFA